MRLAAIVVLGLCVSTAPVRSQTPATALPDVQISWDVSIPTRAGITLAAVVYRPADQTDPLPVVLGFTPYIANIYHPKAVYYAQRGYVFAVVEVRGRGNSGGEFEPFVNEALDGYDVVAWLARQPWSNRKIAMYVGSYGGFDQWAILKERAPDLVSAIPAAAGHPGLDFPFVQNVFVSYVATWLTLTSGATGQWNLFGDAAYWTQRFRKSQSFADHAPCPDV